MCREHFNGMYRTDTYFIAKQVRYSMHSATSLIDTVCLYKKKQTEEKTNVVTAVWGKYLNPALAIYQQR